MIDTKWLRHHLPWVAEQIERQRGIVIDVKTLLELEQKRKTLQSQTQDLQNKRNRYAKAVGEAQSRGEDIQPLRKALGELSTHMKHLQKSCHDVQQTLLVEHLSIPNIVHESVPLGKNEHYNQEIRTWGTPRPWQEGMLNHVQLAERAGWLDLEKAAYLSGARFAVLYGQLARLHRALIAFMLDQHTSQHGYQEVCVPYLVHAKALYGTGQLPKFKEDQFNVADPWDLILIPTGEVPLTNLVGDEILTESSLPIKRVAVTPCFRSEAGSYGKDTHGLIRQHQFTKVELVQIAHPEHSYEALESLTLEAESILQALELPYRVVVLCSGDTGFGAAKTYDIEVWVPSENVYREISSCSNFEAFQARRMQARWRRRPQDKPSWVHTLNGSGLPIERTMVAFIETHQNDNGSICIPQALRPYMGGIDHIGPSS